MTFAITSTTGCARPSGAFARKTFVAPYLPSEPQSSSVRSSPPTTTTAASPPISFASFAPSETAPSEFLLNSPS